MDIDTYHFSDDQLDSLLEEMLENIGHTDPEIRDDLIYNSFVKLILKDYVTKEQTIYILQKCMSEQYLFFNIEDKTIGDSVFTRSFSALVIATILYKDATTRNLSSELVLYAIHVGIEYLLLEQDYRGYVEEKGWAHSIAHGSDLLATCVLHPEFDASQTKACLHAIRKCVLVEYPYIDEEDERLIQVMEALIKKGMEDIELRNWIADLEVELHLPHERYRIEWNVKRFCYSLYITLLQHREFSASRQAILDKYQQNN
ncbi:DUF2785 domain-containing protein [Virgibacillus sp. Bac330]|uniref:DUF2785 domain-containing protein n=1 Tax=Virgibacillus sp. Bac330 TaxID=2419841 RepID=UPI0013CE950E|nr:DUF2785 domain-containing protein [Virgibacillus sp. Bac330]